VHLANETPNQAYYRILKEYCETSSEEVLYRASLMSERFISDGIAPEEIVALHQAAVQEVVKAYDPRNLVASQQMLLEVMIASECATASTPSSGWPRRSG